MNSENIQQVIQLLNLIKYANEELMDIEHEIFLSVYKDRQNKKTSDIYLELKDTIKKNLIDALNSHTKSKIEKYKTELRLLGVEIQ